MFDDEFEFGVLLERKLLSQAGADHESAEGAGGGSDCGTFSAARNHSGRGTDERAGCCGLGFLLALAGGVFDLAFTIVNGANGMDAGHVGHDGDERQPAARSGDIVKREPYPGAARLTSLFDLVDMAADFGACVQNQAIRGGQWIESVGPELHRCFCRVSADRAVEADEEAGPRRNDAGLVG